MIALIAIVLYVLVVLLMTVPEDGLLRNDEGGLLPKSPLISGIIFILFVFFFVVGVSYGFGSGSIRSTHEIPQLMAKVMPGNKQCVPHARANPARRRQPQISRPASAPPMTTSQAAGSMLHALAAVISLVSCSAM